MCIDKSEAVAAFKYFFFIAVRFVLRSFTFAVGKEFKPTDFADLGVWPGSAESVGSVGSVGLDESAVWGMLEIGMLSLGVMHLRSILRSKDAGINMGGVTEETKRRGGVGFEFGMPESVKLDRMDATL